MATVERTPVATDRHRRIDTSVWENEGSDNRTYYNTTLRKSWKDGDEWKESSASLGRDDLLPCSLLLKWADAQIGKAIEAKTQHAGKKPIASKTRGRLEVAVFTSDNDGKTGYRVKLKRSYKDGDEWKDTAVYFMSSDCLAVARVLERTFDKIDNIAAAKSSSFVQTAKETFDASDGGEDIPF